MYCLPLILSFSWDSTCLYFHPVWRHRRVIVYWLRHLCLACSALISSFPLVCSPILCSQCYRLLCVALAKHLRLALQEELMRDFCSFFERLLYSKAWSLLQHDRWHPKVGVHTEVSNGDEDANHIGVAGFITCPLLVTFSACALVQS